ncbi:AraC family transcriptional regulator [Paenibacillus graminis]|uniref:AraC family transcriptional regulator n=1 Tax=Paenibacillus graminis TaxID=189425 RepID=UPI002DBB5581|nr:helix-turn-helix domain-containing protein [Paenibacillus graminis]MEC0166990.1 helix-turn-helix domain-containing protein [Paenibacillus graminis]
MIREGAVWSRSSFEKMFEKQDMLERLDICIEWGHYEIRVLRFHLTSFPAGKVVDFHKHAEFEFHFIPRGRGKVILSGHQYPLSEGMLYLTGPGVIHYQEADAGEAMDELCLHVDITAKEREGVDPWEAAEAEETMVKLRTLPAVPAHDYHRAMHCFLEAYDACDEKLLGYYTSIKQLVISILLKTIRAYDSGDHRAEAPVRNMAAYRYEYAVQYMEANHKTPVTLDNVAEKLHISSRQLQRIFKQVQPERPFSRILEEIRLHAVCRALEENFSSIEQIAQDSGFTNANYLHAVFRKRMGMTPAAFRAMRQQSNSK